MADSKAYLMKGRQIACLLILKKQFQDQPYKLYYPAFTTVATLEEAASAAS